MIGLRQDPLLQQQSKKKRQFHPLTMPLSPPASVSRCDAHGNERNENKVPASNTSSATISDDVGAKRNDACLHVKGTQDKCSRVNVVKSNETNVPIRGNGINTQFTKAGDTANMRKQMRPNKASATKIKLNNTSNSWGSLLRDVIIAFIPMFVLYKLSTNPFVSNIGYHDPNAPKIYSPAEKLEQILTRVAVNKKQGELHKGYLFLEAMNEGKRMCYDFPTIEMPDQTKGHRKRRKRKFMGNTKPRVKMASTGKRRGRKMKRPSASRVHASPPSSTPWSMELASAFWGETLHDNVNVNKGTEATKYNNNVENLQGGGKSSNRKTVKKKWGRR